MASRSKSSATCFVLAQEGDAGCVAFRSPHLTCVIDKVRRMTWAESEKVCAVLPVDCVGMKQPHSAFVGAFRGPEFGGDAIVSRHAARGAVQVRTKHLAQLIARGDVACAPSPQELRCADRLRGHRNSRRPGSSSSARRGRNVADRPRSSWEETMSSRRRAGQAALCARESRPSRKRRRVPSRCLQSRGNSPPPSGKVRRFAVDAPEP
jgi:hypothetical protein